MNRDESRKMMFRVWCKRTKQMQGPGGWFLIQQNGGLFSHGPMRPLEEEPLEHYEVMQYTGLKDKNDVDIYEGDILKQFGRIKEVIFRFGCFGYMGDIDNFIAYGVHYHIDWNNPQIEVIGNIYENPGLLM